MISGAWVSDAEPALVVAIFSFVGSDIVEQKVKHGQEEDRGREGKKIGGGRGSRSKLQVASGVELREWRCSGQIPSGVWCGLVAKWS